MGADHTHINGVYIFPLGKVARSAQILPLDSLLGTARKLGVAPRGYYRLDFQGRQVHLGTDDPRPRVVLSGLYALRLASATTELLALCLPRNQRDRAESARRSLHPIQLPRQQGQGPACRKGQGGGRGQVV